MLSPTGRETYAIDLLEHIGKCTFTNTGFQEIIAAAAIGVYNEAWAVEVLLNTVFVPLKADNDMGRVIFFLLIYMQDSCNGSAHSTMG